MRHAIYNGQIFDSQGRDIPALLSDYFGGTMGNLSGRIKAREFAFKLLFEDTFGTGTAREMLGKLFEDDEAWNSIHEDELTYISFIRENVRAHADEINGIISAFAKGWSIERMNRIDVSILRLALCEILYRDDVTAATAINEAVELAKKYSSDEGPQFINGILGAYVRSL